MIPLCSGMRTECDCWGSSDSARVPHKPIHGAPPSRMMTGKLRGWRVLHDLRLAPSGQVLCDGGRAEGEVESGDQAGQRLRDAPNEPRVLLVYFTAELQTSPSHLCVVHFPGPGLYCRPDEEPTDAA